MNTFLSAWYTVVGLVQYIRNLAYLEVTTLLNCTVRVGHTQ